LDRREVKFEENRELDILDIIFGEKPPNKKVKTGQIFEFVDPKSIPWFYRSLLSHMIISFSDDKDYLAITITEFKKFKIKASLLFPIGIVLVLKHKWLNLLQRIWVGANPPIELPILA